MRIGPKHTGSEPSQARSSLRSRLALAVFGLLCAVAGAVLSARIATTGWVIAFAVLGLVALVDATVVVARIRQGPHYQPGPTVPPYRPVTAPLRDPRRAAARSQPLDVRTRKRLYLLLMGICLTLIVLAWTWVRFYSTTAAVVMSVIAMVIPPFAALIANAGSPINRGPRR
ncbi:DUF3099 domain-containing protein [Carbonactinospora thermoautotrophica]|uniref:DUF3099 domain-containing protein n=1 Tax=Carbonactinospora thermoautotrophica TaxID=1469144 RepID=A0A132MLV6_9ACTN|nr:DUF6343 family protein [Carbonactinospora thermoautotrophica]KWW98857.1 hypothetical protein LI90_487 [Carbonactinospora thermoautotrophica]MCX9191446.1 DUF3099 domain-containing protein [Carbonactinospora thermoautotrophica]